MIVLEAVRVAAAASGVLSEAMAASVVLSGCVDVNFTYLHANFCLVTITLSHFGHNLVS